MFKSSSNAHNHSQTNTHTQTHHNSYYMYAHSYTHQCVYLFHTLTVFCTVVYSVWFQYATRCSAYDSQVCYVLISPTLSLSLSLFSVPASPCYHPYSLNLTLTPRTHLSLTHFFPVSLSPLHSLLLLLTLLHYLCLPLCLSLSSHLFQMPSLSVCVCVCVCLSLSDVLSLTVDNGVMDEPVTLASHSKPISCELMEGYSYSQATNNHRR